MQSPTPSSIIDSIQDRRYKSIFSNYRGTPKVRYVEPESPEARFRSVVTF